LQHVAVGFAVTALLLAVIGIYGVISLNVNSRTNEFGIRLALGAQPRNVLQLVLRQGLRVAAVGVTIGIGAALLFDAPDGDAAVRRHGD